MYINLDSLMRLVHLLDLVHWYNMNVVYILEICFFSILWSYFYYSVVINLNSILDSHITLLLYLPHGRCLLC